MQAPRFSLSIVAAEQDVDELGHVSNLVYLRWVLEAASAHSTAAGYDHDAYVRLGAVWVVRKHELEYLRPVHGGDTLELVTWVDSWRGASSVRKTSMVRPADGAEVARASTLWAFIDLATRRPRRVDEMLQRAFSAAK